MDLQLPQNRYGILLVNLGTPDAPTPKAVRRYLKEFLSDRRVVDVNRLIWWPILNGIILPVRSPKVAKAYQSIWDNDSPLRSIGYKQARGLRERLMEESALECPVELGMTYGNPSITSALERLQSSGCRRIVVLPLYPQYSATTTASVSDVLGKALNQIRHLPEIRMVQQYAQHPLYIKALAGSVKSYWKQQGLPEKLIMSFHGIPQRYANAGDPYPKHCEATAQALAEALELKPEQWMLCYQSRFGREPWLQPYLDKTLENLPKQGIKKVQVICPAFASDCLETLEEIAVENAEVFQDAGGESYGYIHALNDSPCHMKLMASLVKEQLVGW